jgi:ABC-2 type transport system ATP-binding protein
VFVLSPAVPLKEAPQLDGFEATLRADGELEVDKGPLVSLNDLFEKLNDHNIKVVSLRNKANRLEELFMRLVENRQDGPKEVDDG